MLHRGLHIDRYEVDALLGEGGMAEVWSARHRVLGTRRALKVMHQPHAHDRLVEEGRLQAGLDHDNVLPVLDVLTHDGVPVLVMPLVEGPSLREVLSARSLEPQQALPWFLDVLAGVDAAHRHGIVHCDLKPANVLLHRRGERVVPKVADFGIAVRIGQARATREGTLAYAAPEQVLGAAPTVAMDFYALGVILRELAPGAFDDVVEALLHSDPSARLADPEPIRRALLAHEVAAHPLPASALAEVPPAERGPATRPAGASIAPATGLPVRADAFVGRVPERGQLASWLGEPGIVTITGAGGMGKTRLAVAVAHEIGLPTVFVDLTEARTAGDIVRRIGAALGVPLDTGAPERKVDGALSGRGRGLVVLDNFEQVVEHAPNTVGRWHTAAPELTFLVTSRETLRIRGERALPLAPLGLPRDGGTDAVALFEARARQHDPHFALDDTSRPYVEQLVTLLDGLPLAIELAASRCRSLSPRTLLTRLDDRFRLLVSRERDGVERHRTLQAAFDWSWDLLADHEREALAQLSVFEGSFTLEAAEAVVQVEGHWVEDLLAELVDKSWLRSWRPSQGEPRLGLLVSVQAYAAHKLQAWPTVQQAAWDRHAHWYADGADEERFMVHGALEALRETRRDLDNLQAVFRRSLEQRNPATATNAALLVLGAGRGQGVAAPLLPELRRLVALPCAPALARLLLARVLATMDQTAEAIPLLETLAAEVRDDPWLRMKTLREFAMHVWDTASPERGEAPCEEALTLARQLPSRPWEARLLGLRASLRSSMGTGGGEVEIREAIAAFQAVGDLRGEAMQWNNLGVAYSRGSDHETTRRHYLTALSLYERVGSRGQRGWIYQNLAALAFEEGNLDDAASQLTEAIRLFGLVGDRRTEGRRQKLLSRILTAQGDLSAAHEALDRGERTLRGIHDQIGLALLYVGRAELLVAEGRARSARACLVEARSRVGHLAGSSAMDEVERVERLLSQRPDGVVGDADA